MQERKESGQTETFIEHRPIDHFLINTHAFHNAHLVRAVLPRNLIAPIPYTENRQTHHRNLATAFHISQGAKRTANALKAAERKKKTHAESEAERSKKQKRSHSAADQDMDNEGVAMDINHGRDPDAMEMADGG
jgi:hypothetical protein